MRSTILVRFQLIDGKDLRIIKNMYWEQTAAMRVKGEISAFQKIKRGVRQGCVLSPDLFSLYSEIIMRNIEGQPGIRVGGHNINNLRYADDTVLISENEKDLQQLLNTIESKSKEKGLELTSKKTGYGNQSQGRAPTHQHYYQRHQTYTKRPLQISGSFNLK